MIPFGLITSILALLKDRYGISLPIPIDDPTKGAQTEVPCTEGTMYAHEQIIEHCPMPIRHRRQRKLTRAFASQRTSFADIRERYAGR